MAHRWDPVERRLERAEEQIGRLEERLDVALDAIDFALTFYRAAFGEDPVLIDADWASHLENKLEHALVECRRRRDR